MKITVPVPSIRMRAMTLPWFSGSPGPEMDDDIKQLTRLREFFLDSQIDQHREFASVVGLPPMSADVEEMERRDSDRRVEKVAHLRPLIQAYARTMAASTVGFFLSSSEGPLTEEQAGKWQIYQDLSAAMAEAVMLGGMSQMVSRGAISVSR